MDLFEKINRSFGSWYEGLFGGGDDVRPKDILRRILAALEDHRKEGFDNRIYVPNQYILEINVQEEEEKEYLLSFLDRDELEAAVRRYCQQNRYQIRGALDFTIKETTSEEADGKREKVRVRCRYNTKVAEPPKMPALAPDPPPLPPMPVEERTVANVRAIAHDHEEGTVLGVGTPTLMVYAPDTAPFRFPVARQGVQMGRSRRAENDLVIETDGQISKRHAKIERDPDGRYTLYDLGSTNGVKVNGRRIDNRTLNDGDEILIGQTRLTFQTPRISEGDSTGSEEGARPRPPGVFGGAAAPERPSVSARLILLENGQPLDEFLLASETSIGRGVTNDIVLPDRSLAIRQARITHDGIGYTLEGLADQGTALNGVPLTPHQPIRLTEGDLLTLGVLTLRFVGGA